MDIENYITKILSFGKPSHYLKQNTPNNHELYTIIPEILVLRELRKEKGRPSEFEHTVRVVDGLQVKDIGLSNLIWMRWMALFHDIGKAVTCQVEDGVLRYPDHDVVSARMTNEIFNRIKIKNLPTNDILHMIAIHMRVNRTSDEMDFINLFGGDKKMTALFIEFKIADRAAKDGGNPQDIFILRDIKNKVESM